MNVTKPQIELIAFILCFKNNFKWTDKKTSECKSTKNTKISQNSKYKIHFAYSKNSPFLLKIESFSWIFISIRASFLNFAIFRSKIALKTEKSISNGSFLNDFMSKMDVFTCLAEWRKIYVRILRFLRLEVNHKLIQTNLKNMEEVDLSSFGISIWSQIILDIVHVNSWRHANTRAYHHGLGVMRWRRFQSKMAILSSQNRKLGTLRICFLSLESLFMTHKLDFSKSKL